MSTVKDQQQALIGAKWSSENRKLRTRWWESERIKRHINRTAVGIDHSGRSAALNHLLASTGRKFARGLSVGCGIASKEMVLLRLALVEHFDCYELSEKRVEAGRSRAAELGLSDRISISLLDVFQHQMSTNYDLVYWNSALHHMMDVEQAVVWSRDRLGAGGVLAMDDFVGPTGFQWEDRHLHYVNSFRARLPDRVFQNGRESFPRHVVRVDPERLWQKDPSEAADSSRIIPSLRKWFPNIRVIPMGGAIYHTALNNILANLDESADAEIIDEALFLDDFMVKIGHTNYAIAVAEV